MRSSILILLKMLQRLEFLVIGIVVEGGGERRLHATDRSAARRNRRPMGGGRSLLLVYNRHRGLAGSDGGGRRSAGPTLRRAIAGDAVDAEVPDLLGHGRRLLLE